MTNPTDAARWARSLWDRYARADARWAVLATNDEQRFWRSGEEEIAALEQHGLIASGDRVADFGAGIGRLSIPLSKRVREVVSIDVSAEMLARLRSNARERPNVRTALVGADPLPPGPFDAVVSFLVLQHLPPHQVRETLDGLRERLSPKGRIIIDLPVRDWPGPDGGLRDWREHPASQLWESRSYLAKEAEALLFEPAGLRLTQAIAGIRDRKVLVLEPSGASKERRNQARARAAAVEASAIAERLHLRNDQPHPSFVVGAERLRGRFRRAANRAIRRLGPAMFPRAAELGRVLTELMAALERD